MSSKPTRRISAFLNRSSTNKAKAQTQTSPAIAEAQAPVTPITNGQSSTHTSPAEKEPVVSEATQPASLKEFREQIKKNGFSLTSNIHTISAIVDLIRNKEALDDRKLLLEHALVFVSRLEDGPMAHTLKNKIIELLYNDLCHPPATSISNKYAWRTADGSYNNIDLPDLGKAGTPYSRSVQQSHPLPRNQLPDPGLVFDTLLKRQGFKEHPGGLSSLMFSFAALVIHSVFRTSHRDVNINETSSYVDLAPLYGNSQADQDKIRIRDGRGKLYPDVFAEDRLLLLPPAVCVLLVCFSRNHNYIAEKLLEINERGTFVDPATINQDDPASKAKLLAQEEEIFQTARLVNCGWFGMIVFSDYFSAILGLVRDGNNWSLMPFDEIRKEDHSLFERGKGNVVSVEFNCLYRWHATTSREDEQWTQKVFQQLFGDKPSGHVTVDDFKMAAMKIARTQPDITHWTFGGIKREEDGSFRDQDLANIVHNATEHSAHAFGARGTPEVMRLNEVMGIEQNRKWGTCNLNDFRTFLGLKPYKTFLEWNSNPEIANVAERLYGDINYLELYVGLQAEEAKPLVDGAGLCPGYTVSRAILSDAIALTRGDRFFTHDFTPFNLTAWGFADCQRDPNAFGFGSVLGKLLLRTLPDHFTENSIYTFFPMMTPPSMKLVLDKLKLNDQYDTARPTAKRPTVILQGPVNAKAVLQGKTGFTKPYDARARRIIQGTGFFPAEGEKEQQAVVTILSSPDLITGIGKYFYETTKKLTAVHSYTLVGNETSGVDLIKHVVKTVPVHWAANDLAGITLKTSETAGKYTSGELADMLGEIYDFIFLHPDAAKVMVLQEKAKKNVHNLLDLIKDNLDEVVGSKFVSRIVGGLSKPKKTEYHDIVTRLYEIGHSRDQLANTLLALMIVSSIELSLALTNIFNTLLGTPHGDQISTLVKDNSGKAQLDGYVYEALRLDPTFRGMFRTSTKDQTINGQDIKQGDRVFVDVSSINLDGDVFANPSEFNITRATKDRVYTDGVFNYLGEGLTIKILSEVVRAVFEYPNIRRAPGVSGILGRFKDHSRPELNYSYLSKQQLPSPWPTSLSILYNSKK
ncbi:linoleate diol synthase [Crepidotus variabilis]|uniref:Linoleate diol synthase n=1 Tax=Crepidotus variabilis TaxID=179855 RepID=A0A9P6JS08_9AGAR|nr:linoleate diol synthase [Crepidotus variabilis]